MQLPSSFSLGRAEFLSCGRTRVMSVVSATAETMYPRMKGVSSGYRGRVRAWAVWTAPRWCALYACVSSVQQQAPLPREP